MSSAVAEPKSAATPAAAALPHIPVIRRGRAYDSLDKSNVINHRTGEVIAQVSTINAGIIRKEMTTPTGAAIITTLGRRFGPLPLIHVESIGYGAGGRNPAELPNMLRLIIGELVEPAEEPVHQGQHDQAQHQHVHHHPHAH